MASIKAYLYGDRVLIRDRDDANRIYQKGYFGEPLEGGGLSLSLIEAAYLSELGRIRIVDPETNREISHDDLLRIAFKEDRKLISKYLVYRDLRNRGYIVKSGLKYGADFRVYDKGVIPDREHSAYLVRVIPEEELLRASDLAGWSRIAVSVRKKMILALVDMDGDITYYQMEWRKL